MWILDASREIWSSDIAGGRVLTGLGYLVFCLFIVQISIYTYMVHALRTTDGRRQTLTYKRLILTIVRIMRVNPISNTQHPTYGYEKISLHIRAYISKHQSISLTHHTVTRTYFLRTPDIIQKLTAPTFF